MAIYGDGTPLTIGGELLYSGKDRTNGRLILNADGNLSWLRQGASSFNMSASNPNFADGFIPWGSGLWRDTSLMTTAPGRVQADKPTKSVFCGVLQFNQSFQTGNPLASYGMPTYMSMMMISRGLVGYKHAMTSTSVGANYLTYLKQGYGGTQDVPATRTVFSNWMTMLAAANDGDVLGIFFCNTNGAPIVAVVPVASQGNPTLAGATFGGFAEVYEPENEMIQFAIRQRAF
jgi:hypothetical protein